MSGPWDNGFRPRKVEFDDIIYERSTSAPPPETGFLFGRNDSLLTPNAPHARAFDSTGNWDTSRDNYPERSTTFDSLFDSGRESTASKSFGSPPPGFSPEIQRHPHTRQGLDLRNLQGLPMDYTDHRLIGETMVRSHSAAPSLDTRLSMDPPLGFMSNETPQVSNRTDRESYLGPAVDGLSILHLGQRRPASTGVIGASQNPSSSVLTSLGLAPNNPGAVRPSAKSLMDLIQEDFPPDSPLDQRGYDSQYSGRNDFMLERPRTTSPQSQSARAFLYDRNHPARGGFGLDGAHEQHLANMSPFESLGSRIHMDRELSNRVYAPVAKTARPQAKTVQEQAHLEQRQFHQRQQGHRRDFGNQPPSVQQRVEAHVLPTGQTVYVNAPPPHYGYTTVQYHHPSQQHHIVHQVSAGLAPQGEQYVSVVPIQNGTAAIPPHTNGSFAYFQADERNNGHQTYAIINPSQNPVHNGGSRSKNRDIHDSTRAQSTKGKERNKSRRNGGGANNKRNESKSQPTCSLSPLLEDFKAKKNRNWTALDIKGHVVEFCQDQNGSRFIQQRLEVGSPTEREVVMEEVLPAIRRLRNDVFGNYVIQKLLEHGTQQMKREIRDTLQGEMLKLSLQMYGCRVIQKALETLDDEDVPPLIDEYHNNVLSCIHDQNGNHVIQKCIEVMSDKSRAAKAKGEISKAQFFEDQIEFIVSDALGNVEELSCHPYGCRVLQRILEHCPDPNRSKALNEIEKCHRILLDDQYGNYVIQHVLQYGRESDRESILEIVVSNGVLLLSRQKFASNVVEKLLKYGNPTQRLVIVRDMLKIVDDRSGLEVPEGTQGTSAVLLMVRDAYANYVVQTTLDVLLEGEEKERLMEELNAHSTELKNYTFAKHIVSKLGT